MATRREWLASVPAAAISASQSGTDAARRPNIVIIISDQFRADCLGSLGMNPMGLTPNLDVMASRGTLFTSACCNQPVCAPARASMFTGQYPSRHGVWHNSAGLPEDAVTLARVLRQAGYSANYIGKWHLAPTQGTTGRGAVAARYRGGFDDLWEGANALEWTSHAYEGELYDNDGQPVRFSGQYRADFLTDRGLRFLRTAKQPFLLVLSYLEVHHQNDTDTFDPPKEFANRYPNPFVPHDLRALPGSWPSQLSAYFACVAKMDEEVGTVRKALADNGQAANTLLVFIKDHGCHFKTRNTEYKRSPHESSIHIPLIMEGPGFNRGLRIPELVGQVDLAPTLLAAAGVPIPGSMQGHSMLPLLDRHTGDWRNELYFEMSEFVTGRGLRTPQYTYAVAAPKRAGWKPVASAEQYVEYMLYDLAADPYQQVNLAGRAEYVKVSAELRGRLLDRIREASGATPTIEACWFPYC